MSDAVIKNLTRNVPITYEIRRLFHCRRCTETCPTHLVLDEHTRVAVGLTPYGLQMWCLRHKENIVHIDFCGQQLPANIATRRG